MHLTPPASYQNIASAWQAQAASGEYCWGDSQSVVCLPHFFHSPYCGAGACRHFYISSALITFRVAIECVLYGGEHERSNEEWHWTMEKWKGNGKQAGHFSYTYSVFGVWSSTGIYEALWRWKKEATNWTPEAA